MGLFSKLLGSAAEQTLKKAVNSAVNTAVNNAVNNAVNTAVNNAVNNVVNNAVYGGSDTSVKPQQSYSSYETVQPRPAQVRQAEEDEPSGFSWGAVMPQEENQYNYPGSYVDYFAHVFREDFPAYRVTHEQVRRSTVFTFRSAAGVKALVVELMTENSEAQRLRKECAAQGLPYLRFYYDHEGWWNTRAYVTQRVQNALR